MTEKPVRKAGRPVSQKKGEDILQAARKVVFSEGPQALTMERVALEAEVSKVTLYARYANRHELLQAVVVADTTSVYQSLDDEPESLEELQDGLCALANAMAHYIRSEHYRQLTLVMGAIPQRSQDLEAVYRNGPERAHLVLADYLRVAAGKGFIHCPDPLEQAELLMGMILGLDLLRSTYRVELEPLSAAAIETRSRRVIMTFLKTLSV
ncbi:Bacterial regulatory protein, tetR family [compost metagenome]